MAMAGYTKNLFTAPHVNGNPLQPDLTRLPVHMRDSVHVVDPLRDSEACAHLLAATDPLSLPGARVRSYIVEEAGRAPRVALRVLSLDGKTNLVQLHFSADQFALAYAALSALMTDARIAAQIPAQTAETAAS